MEQFVWVEKYRPQTLDEVILPERIKKSLKSHVRNGDLPNILLHGPPGVGKTTCALALINELGRDVLIKNGSKDVDMAALRNDIAQFAGSVSFMNPGRKYVILDEADNMNHVVQPALRNFMEEYSSNCGFILTCNRPSQLHEALRSRVADVEFLIRAEEAEGLCTRFFKRLVAILNEEGITYDPSDAAEIIEKYFPDWRKVLNETQHASVTGTLDSSVFTSQADIEELVGYMKKKDFTSVRRWVGETPMAVQQGLYRKFYDVASDLFTPQTIPALTMILGKYQHMATFAVDQHINLAACFAEIMVETEFK